MIVNNAYGGTMSDKLTVAEKKIRAASTKEQRKTALEELEKALGIKKK